MTSRRAGRTWVGRAAPAVAAAVLGAGLAALAAPPPDQHRQREGSDVSAPHAPAGTLTDADGVVPDGVTVFDDQVPAIARLDPALLAALRRAATDAARRDHVTLQVNSGWRSVAYQEQLLRDAVVEHGSLREAARWVSTPGTSAHVSGDAVDIGPPEAARWLSAHGSAYGLCQTYANEAWHYELRPGAVARGCPSMFADPTHDPRMQP